MVINQHVVTATLPRVASDELTVFGTVRFTKSLYLFSRYVSMHEPRTDKITEVNLTRHTKYVEPEPETDLSTY